VKERLEPEAPPAKIARPQVWYVEIECCCCKVRPLQDEHAEETQGSTSGSAHSSARVRRRVDCGLSRCRARRRQGWHVNAGRAGRVGTSWLGADGTNRAGDGNVCRR
jgi:hypothetical protein